MQDPRKDVSRIFLPVSFGGDVTNGVGGNFASLNGGEGGGNAPLPATLTLS